MDLMTVKEVAQELGVKPNQVRVYCQAGKLGKRWQRRWIITREEFEIFKRDVYTGQVGRPRKEDD